MNHKLPVLKIEDGELEEVARSVRSSKEISNRVIVKLHPGDGMFKGVNDVFVRNLMTPSRRVDLHLLSVLRKYGESTRAVPDRDGVTGNMALECRHDLPCYAHWHTLLLNPRCQDNLTL
jgi:hypothetical protein